MPKAAQQVVELRPNEILWMQTHALNHLNSVHEKVQTSQIIASSYFPELPLPVKWAQEYFNMLSFITKGSQEQILLLRRVTLPVDIPEGVSPVLVFLFGFASVFLQLFLQNVTTSVFCLFFQSYLTLRKCKNCFFIWKEMIEKWGTVRKLKVQRPNTTL